MNDARQAKEVAGLVGESFHLLKDHVVNNAVCLGLATFCGSTLSDETLFEKARSGDQGAFNSLYRKPGSAMFDVLYCLCGSAEARYQV